MAKKSKDESQEVKDFVEIKNFVLERNEERLTKLLDALEQSGGVVRTALELTGISTNTFYRYFKNNKDVQEKIRECRTIGVLHVTDVLYQQALNGDKHAIATYLKFSPDAKALGWKQESSVNITNVEPLSDEEKANVIKEHFGELK